MVRGAVKEIICWEIERTNEILESFFGGRSSVVCKEDRLQYSDGVKDVCL
ncbi:MAG: hypothetical protein QXF82_06060 [Nitrososphaeria archaeon]